MNFEWVTIQDGIDDVVGIELSVSTPDKAVGYDGAALPVSAAMYGLYLDDADKRLGPTLVDINEAWRRLFEDCSRDVASYLQAQEQRATASDMPAIRKAAAVANVPVEPAALPAPKARPALAALTLARPIDHRPGLWQAVEGA